MVRPDYGIDAPGVLRNLFLGGFAFLAVAIFAPRIVSLGPVEINCRSFYWPAGFLIVEALLFLLYVKYGKFRHRDLMLSLHEWRGDEQVLDVGTGRGLLLVGAAKRLTRGHATGLDIWSTVDLSGNAAEAAQRNLEMEGVASRCTLVSESAAEMSFPDASFDVIVSNLCVHNIYDRPTRMRALGHIVRVLKPGGVALISDYKLTGEYAKEFERLGLAVSKKHGGFLTTFPPLTIVIARKS